MIQKSESGTNDVFAEIANQGMNFGSKALINPEPLFKEDKVLPFNGHANTIPYKPSQKMSSADELQSELNKQRDHYAPFMRDLAPVLPSFRSRTYLTDFDWRMQSEADIRNFRSVLSGDGQWEKVKVPHYGGPVGKAVSYYRTSFCLGGADFEVGSVFLSFKGVDYIAHVFLNDSYLGSHEGFFAPFEFDITRVAREGDNSLVVVVENDIICGNDGDKIYAATGLGYDDPEVGWHHCPPGMGIYQDVYVETRSAIHVHDVFVRPIPEEQRAEAWVEIFSCETSRQTVTLDLSVYGQNFDATVFSGLRYRPVSNLQVGLGDSLTEAIHRSDGSLGQEIPLFVSKGINTFKIPLTITDMRWWEPASPWLYQLQVKVVNEDGQVMDTQKSQFGMRSFKMDTENTPKGALYLNGRRIRLRGSNTMGHEQQCVFKKDWDQLRDDILLAKICNMNFWRLTQRPVQPEVYEFCDKLGLMTQTDMPHFGVIRRNQFCESVRQAEEMERLIRSHPCNIMISYINEPFPNAKNRPHLHLERHELLDHFRACDIAVRLCNPDRVIKHIDGDYDPPSDGLPDNHCYPAWYNGHGIDLGRLNKGYWLPVKPDWYYGCGEFGAEGLDPVDVMRRYYPTGWLPQEEQEEKLWSPNQIIGAQTGAFHYFFFDTPAKLEDWVTLSQKHQAWATRFMTEAFRRDSRMTTFAIHLFIDAFPAGWMKTIMDVDRKPKASYFAYRDALTPLMCSLRSDRYKVFAGEEINIEAWICNDFIEVPQNTMLHYQIEMDERVLQSGSIGAQIPECSSKFQGYIRFSAPEVADRSPLIIRLALVDYDGNCLHDTQLEVEVFASKTSENTFKSACILGEANGKAAQLAADLGILADDSTSLQGKDIILIDDYSAFTNVQDQIIRAVEQGAIAVLLELPSNQYDICDTSVRVKPCGMLPVHFASRNTGHSLVEEFRPDDFRLWYDPAVDYITPLLETTFTAPGFEEILTGGNTDSSGKWQKALAAAQKKIGKGCLRICQVKLAGRTNDNPIAYLFARRLLNL